MHPSVLGSVSLDQESRASVAAHSEGAPTNRQRAGSNLQPQMLKQVTPSHEIGPDHDNGWGLGNGSNWGSSGGWEGTNPWGAEAWGAETAKEPKKGKKRKADAEPTDAPVPSQRVSEKSDAPAEVPLTVFDPLLQLLRETKKRTMGRSKLGEELAKNKGIYKTAGVKGFAEYIALAAAKNLVIAGGIDKGQYVRMHPRLKNSQ